MNWNGVSEGLGRMSMHDVLKKLAEVYTEIPVRRSLIASVQPRRPRTSDREVTPTPHYTEDTAGSLSHRQRATTREEQLPQPEVRAGGLSPNDPADRDEDGGSSEYSLHRDAIGPRPSENPHKALSEGQLDGTTIRPWETGHQTNSPEQTLHTSRRDHGQQILRSSRNLAIRSRLPRAASASRDRRGITFNMENDENRPTWALTSAEGADPAELRAIQKTLEPRQIAAPVPTCPIPLQRTLAVLDGAAPAVNRSEARSRQLQSEESSSIGPRLPWVRLHLPVSEARLRRQNADNDYLDWAVDRCGATQRVRRWIMQTDPIDRPVTSSQRRLEYEQLLEESAESEEPATPVPRTLEPHYTPLWELTFMKDPWWMDG